MKDQHQAFMQQALKLAQQRRGFCAPNPAVGAIVVKEGHVIAEGTHWACGYPHAEAAALQTLGEKAAGATLYVTLEPCSHHGRTPPCTDLIIHTGIRKVVFGMYDPNPQVCGQGVNILREAGISCELLPSAEIDRFYEGYRYWLQKRLPWVTIKLAISLDGKIAGFQGAPVQLTGAECQRYTHQRRLQSDAILTTDATLIADNPQMNVRLDGKIIAKPLYVLDEQLRVPLTAQIFRTTKSLTFFHGAAAAPEKQAQLRGRNVTCIAVSSTHSGLNLLEILTYIGAQGCHDLWVEAGGRCFQSFLTQSLAQCALIYIAPKTLGPTAVPAFSQALPWPASQLSWTSLGADGVLQIRLTGEKLEKF